MPVKGTVCLHWCTAVSRWADRGPVHSGTSCPLVLWEVGRRGGVCTSIDAALEWSSGLYYRYVLAEMNLRDPKTDVSVY